MLDNQAHLAFMQSHAGGLHVATAHARNTNLFCCSMQNHAYGVDVGVQLLDSPDRALCTDRRQAAAAAAVCGGHERHQACAAAVLLWMSQ